ncbi:hypothetical protein, partial [Pediococcus claussenii]|uniref:hypothetical protein n=1 Tax=Pediococcus claussenii TaxID=187452 RepID=UPI001F3F7965
SVFKGLLCCHVSVVSASRQLFNYIIVDLECQQLFLRSYLNSFTEQLNILPADLETVNPFLNKKGRFF